MITNYLVLNQEEIPTVAGGRWHSSTVLGIIKNEKFKGDAFLQKTYSKDHLSKKKCVNKGEVDSYYIQDNHPPIVAPKLWETAQIIMKERAKAKGNTGEASGKYQKLYPLTGMLFCSKCGGVLRRRTWNSKHTCKKIVWQCSTYIKEGKNACQGTTIDDAVIGKMKIQRKTVVQEVIRDGQKHYRYTSEGK